MTYIRLNTWTWWGAPVWWGDLVPGPLPPLNPALCNGYICSFAICAFLMRDVKHLLFAIRCNLVVREQVNSWQESQLTYTTAINHCFRPLRTLNAVFRRYSLVYWTVLYSVPWLHVAVFRRICCISYYSQISNETYSATSDALTNKVVRAFKTACSGLATSRQQVAQLGDGPAILQQLCCLFNYWGKSLESWSATSLSHPWSSYNYQKVETQPKTKAQCLILLFEEAQLIY